jgi:DNA mismatch repair ATPase MutL
VLALLHALETSLLSQPSQLRSWRLRDISQLVQAYALIGYRCGPLFSVIAQHLTEDQQSLHEQQHQQRAAAQQQQQQQQQQAAAQQQQQQRGWQQQAQPPQAQAANVLSAAYPSGSSSSSWAPSSSGTSTSYWNSQRNAKPWHDKGRGTARLAECSVSDAVGITWGFVHAFCPQQLLLHELAGVLVARAGQLHAADVSRLLWAYATAEVSGAPVSAYVCASCPDLHMPYCPTCQFARSFFFKITGGAHPPPAGHTQLSRVNSTAGGRRQSLTDEGRLTHPISEGAQRLDQKKRGA